MVTAASLGAEAQQRFEDNGAVGGAGAARVVAQIDEDEGPSGRSIGAVRAIARRTPSSTAMMGRTRRMSCRRWPRPGGRGSGGALGEIRVAVGGGDDGHRGVRRVGVAVAAEDGEVDDGGDALELGPLFVELPEGEALFGRVDGVPRALPDVWADDGDEDAGG